MDYSHDTPYDTPDNSMIDAQGEVGGQYCGQAVGRGGGGGETGWEPQGLTQGAVGMQVAGLAGKVKANQSPVVWRLAATACRVARRVSRHRSRWSSRLGYALERLDEAREARRDATAERRWLARVPGEVAQQLRLARQREQSADWAGAANAYREAVKYQGADPAWWYRLGKCLKAAGDAPGAVDAWRRAVELGGGEHPRWAVKLADLLDRVGEWDRARQVLTENTARHPTHALSHRRLGEISLTLAQWGGSFTGTLPGRGHGSFRFDHPYLDSLDRAPRQQPSPAAAARRALERAAELEPAKTTWREALAEARLADGDPHGAIALYEAALRDAEQSTGRWVLAVKHRWQFRLEWIHHQLGQPRVEDPLFECAAEPGKPAPADAGPAAEDGGGEPVAGLFTARIVFGGLAVSGLAATEDVDQVEILLDGVPIRAVNVGGDGFFPQFNLEIKRATLASFPRQAALAVRAPDGTRLRGPGGADELRITVPHGSGDLAEIVAGGGKLDKKGVISPSLAETQQRQQRYLEIYAKVRDFFEQELGKPLFLMYGTLLGYYREGDFIPGDDDFDCGYISDKTDPAAVKEETKRLIVRLVRAGFTVSFNRKGRLFRIQLEREATDGYHLDVRPLWFQDGRVWVHNHCSFPSRREEFLPVVEGELRGERVLAPRNTEAFLRGHYGPGWHTPDPAFMYYLSEIDPAILDNLGKALLTVSEYRELAARVRREAGDGPPAGRLVSVGSQDLYPLAQFLP